MLVVLAALLLPWAFSDDLLKPIIEGTSIPFSILIPVDIFGICILLLMSLVINGVRQVRKSAWWWLSGTFLNLLLDSILVFGKYSSALASALMSVGYTAVIVLFVGAVAGASPLLLIRPHLRDSRPEEWTRLRGGIPLTVGVLSAYLASMYWEHSLNPSAVRTWPSALAAYARSVGLGNQVPISGAPEGGSATALIRSMCSGAVDQEYFAQVSQVIPLLLIAIGIEARFFQRVSNSTERAMTIIAVAALCLAECVAISALPFSNDQCGSILSERHEYAAFIVTVAACAITLSTLAWALLERGGPSNKGDLEISDASSAQKLEESDRRVNGSLPGALILAVVILNSIRRRMRRRR